MAKPGGLTSNYKQLYDERIFILENILGYYVFPTAREIFIYENKRFLSFWLRANKIPHPVTNVFYDKDEAKEFLDSVKYPIVGKVNIGASGSGVEILRSRIAATKYLQNTFSDKGAKQRIGPDLNKAGIIKRGFHYVVNPTDIKRKLAKYKKLASNVQRDFVIFQEFVEHSFEWRVVRIGDSFFAHKKLVLGDKASGSLLKEYDNPPLELLDFVKGITDEHHLFSQAVDIFESGNKFLVNEMQCIFGQSDNYQMLVDGKQGRYRFINAKWIFEEGDFCKNACYNLRIETVLNKLRSAL